MNTFLFFQREETRWFWKLFGAQCVTAYMSIDMGKQKMVSNDISATTKTFAILAKRGAGKSYTGAVMARVGSREGREYFTIGIGQSTIKM